MRQQKTVNEGIKFLGRFLWSNKNRHFINSKLPLSKHDYVRAQFEGDFILFSIWEGDNPLNTATKYNAINMATNTSIFICL